MRSDSRTCEAGNGQGDSVTIAAPPPWTEIGAAPPPGRSLPCSNGREEGFLSVPAGNSSLHATKYSQREGHRHTRQSDAGNWFFSPYFSKNTPPVLTWVCPLSPPRTARIVATPRPYPGDGDRRRNQSWAAIGPGGGYVRAGPLGLGRRGVPGCCGERSRREGAVPRGGRGAARAREGGASGAQPPGCQATASAGLTVGEAEARRRDGRHKPTGPGRPSGRPACWKGLQQCPAALSLGGWGVFIKPA